MWLNISQKDMHKLILGAHTDPGKWVSETGELLQILVSPGLSRKYQRPWNPGFQNQKKIHKL